jgi:hypothetical protein
MRLGQAHFGVVDLLLLITGMAILITLLTGF